MSVRSHSIEKSRAFLARSQEITIRCCQSHKRTPEMLAHGYPIFAQRAQGARFWDVDGNEYLDYLLGFGPILLGYDDPAVNAAIRRQIEEGTIYTTAHPKELEIAERLIALIPGAEMVGFFIGGSAATSAATRIARAYTDRDYIARCGYHGWHDWCISGAGVPKGVSELTLGFPYNDLDRLEDGLKQNPDKVACVIVETVQGTGPAEGFLQGVVDLAHQYGALAIFDEVKVGFRVAYGGGGEYCGVIPDLSAFGKACCNGYPGSFVAGKKEILSKCEGVWVGATFHCDLPSLVAMEAVIAEMKRRDGIAYQWKIGARLMEGINAACEEAGVPFRLVGLAPMPTPVVSDPPDERVMKMIRGALARGHYLHYAHPWFLSLSHTEADIESTIEAVSESLADLE